MNQKATFAIAIALVGGIGISLANPWNQKTATLDPMPVLASQKSKSKNHSNVEMVTKKSSLNMDVAGIKYVKVTIELGKVKLSTHSGSSFSADITKCVSRPIGDKERQWLDNPWLKAKRDGDTLIIYEDKSLKPDLSHLNSSSSSHFQIDFKVDIQVPSGLDADVSIEAGTASAVGDFRALTTHISAGQLILDHLNSSDSLNIDLGAGEVNAQLDRLPSQDSKIHVGVGQINLDATGNAKIQAETGIGSVSLSGETKKRGKRNDDEGLGSKQEVQIGSGGVRISLEVGAGNIKFGHGTADHPSQDGEMNMDFVKDMEAQSMKSVDMDEIQAEVDKGMKEVDKDFLNDSKIQSEIDRAMKEVDKDFMSDSKIQSEVANAMKEAQTEMNTAFKDADREMTHALKEIDAELKRNEISDEGFGSIIRDALENAKRAIQQSMKTTKKAMANAKSASRKAINSKTEHV